jgi:hypothetical protein
MRGAICIPRLCNIADGNEKRAAPHRTSMEPVPWRTERMRELEDAPPFGG